MKEIELEDVKKIELEMLKYIDKTCRENNIEYFLIAGSLLGAVRHNDIIPWDDDIDIGLKQDDYYKLIDILTKKSNERYKLLNHDIEETYFYPFSKLVDTSTVLNEKKYKPINDYGVFIDIFMFYDLPNDKSKREHAYKKQKEYIRLIHYWAFTNKQIGKEKNIFKKYAKYILKFYTKILGIDRILDRYNKLSKICVGGASEYCMSNWTIYNMENEIQNKSFYENLVDWEFNDIVVKIPKEYDKILTQVYGDYMQLPSKEKRHKSHDSIAYLK